MSKNQKLTYILKMETLFLRQEKIMTTKTEIWASKLKEEPHFDVKNKFLCQKSKFLHQE